MTRRVDGNTPLWIAARALLLERGDDFFGRAAEVLEKFDPDDIHDLRVASRRLREGMALFAPCYQEASVVPLAKRIKRVTGLLGNIRNTDEAILFFSSLDEETGEHVCVAPDSLLRMLRDKRESVTKKLRSELPELVPPSLRELLHRVFNEPLLFKDSPPGVDFLGPLLDFARTSLDERLSQVLQRVPPSREADRADAQHLLRIAVKHYRYRLEILSFLVAERYAEIHSALKGYQDVLGRMHDMDVFDAAVRKTDLPAETTELLCYIIKNKRKKYFADFSAMLEALPLETMGAGLGGNR